MLLSANLHASIGRAWKAYDGQFTSVAPALSRAMDISNFHHVGIQYIYAVVAGAAGGACEMQVSNNGVDYETVTNSNNVLEAGDSGTSFVNKANISAKWMRAKCLNNDANPITMTIILSGK